MNNFKRNAWKHLNQVREIKPLVHNITNQVVTEFAANTLLACGASPLMAHEPDELKEIVQISNVLVLNIGTLDSHQINDMKTAIDFANSRNQLIIVDPVGAGASQLRTQTALDLINKSKRCIIKGNGSEVLALNNSFASISKGVDSSAESSTAISAAQNLIKKFDIECVVITGQDDFVINEKNISKHSNGNSLMARVTGTGCSLAGIIGAFCSIEANLFEACQSAVNYYSLCGELASQKASGPGSFKMHFLDQLHNLDEIQIKTNLQAYNV